MLIPKRTSTNIHEEFVLSSDLWNFWQWFNVPLTVIFWTALHVFQVNIELTGFNAHFLAPCPYRLNSYSEVWILLNTTQKYAFIIWETTLLCYLQLFNTRPEQWCSKLLLEPLYRKKRFTEQAISQVNSKDIDPRVSFNKSK